MKTLITTLLLMVSIGTYAAESCVQSELAGRWKMYLTTSTEHEMPARTILVLDEYGLLAESKPIKYADGLEFGWTDYAFLELQSWCVVKGVVEFYAAQGFLHLENAHMDEDKNTIIGTFYILTYEGEFWGAGTFMATKYRRMR